MAAPMMKSSFKQNIYWQRKIILLYSNHSSKTRCFNTENNAFKSNDQTHVTSNSASTKSKPTTSSVSASPKNLNSLNSSATDRLGHIMQMYEDLVGLTEVKTAQDNVVEAERNFLKIQEDRRTLQQEITEIQSEVRSVATELEKTHRTDPCYIDLVKKEHGILVKERDMSSKLKTLDRCERDLFSILSMCVRESHEKERARAERTKYWSVMGSIIGAIIGITGSTINNHRRLKEMRSIVKESGESSAEYKEVADKALASLSSIPFLHNVSGNENNNNLENSHLPYRTDASHLEKFQQLTETLYKDLNVHTSQIMSNLLDIKKLVAVSHSSDGSDNIVYVGPELKSLLKETEYKLEQNANKNLVISLSAVGGIFTIGLSLMVFLFRGS